MNRRTIGAGALLFALASGPVAADTDAGTPADASIRSTLSKGIEGNVYLMVHLANRHGTRLYCAPPAARRPARFAIISGTGALAYVPALPLSITEWDAIFKTADELSSDVRFSTPARRCMIIDMTDMPNSPTASAIVKTSYGEGLLLGRIKVLQIDLAASRVFAERADKREARAYRVTYEVQNPGHARPFPEITGRTFQANCAVRRDLGEQNFHLTLCAPIAEGN